MDRILSMIAVLSILSLGFVPGSQANSMARSGLTTYDTTKLIGLTVKARDGVQLSQIYDLVVDSNGHVDFAIVSQPGFEEVGGRFVIVPYSTLIISRRKSGELSAVLSGDKGKFYGAPDQSDTSLANMKQAASVERYYGTQPYWTGTTRKTGSHK
jgi:sporulation protein YlmC with PRC-barrel domain